MKYVVISLTLGLCACGGGSSNGGSTPPPASSSSASSQPSSVSSISRSSSSVQPVTWREQYLLEAPGASEVTDVLVTPDNQLYVAGYIRGVVGQSNIVPAGNASGVVYKVTAATAMTDVNPVYQLETTATDTIEALAYNPQNQQVYFAGRTSGTLPGQWSAGQFDAVLGVLGNSSSSVGLVQWGDAAPQHPVAMAFARNNQVAVAGYDDVYVPSNYVDAWRDPFLTLLNPWGNSYTRAWEIEYSTVGEDDLQDLAVAPGDRDQIVVVGRVYNSAERGPFVASYDSDAAPLWRHRMNLQGLDNLAAVVINAQGRVLVGGTAQIANPPLASAGRDFVVFELDPQTGEVIHSESYGTVFDDHLTAMALDTEGNIYLAGESNMATTAEIPATQEALLIKLNSQGNEVMRKRWQSPTGFFAVTSVAVSQQGRAFVGGYARSVDSYSHQGILVTVDTKVQL